MDLIGIVTAYGTVMAIQLGNVGLQAYLRHRRAHRLRGTDTTSSLRGGREEDR